jgi:hypothetical protein
LLFCFIFQIIPGFNPFLHQPGKKMC